MYTWKGLHYVGYIRYIITLFTVKSIKVTSTTVTSNGTIKISDNRKKPYLNSLWRAVGLIQPNASVHWTVYCDDHTPDCREPSGEPAFTVVIDTNDDIRAFITDHVSRALTQHKST